MKTITNSKIIVLVSVFLMLFGNISFFSNVLDVYPLNMKNALFLLSIALVFGSVIVVLLSLVCYKYTIKPILIVVLLVSSAAAYFMDSYQVVINEDMIDNIIKTDMAESVDLLSFKQLLYILLLGVVPSIVVAKANIVSSGFKQAIISRVALLGLATLLAIGTILVFSSYYASFFREHKPLRYYANPTYLVYSVGKYLRGSIKIKDVELKITGLNAKIPESDTHRELIILVVGETARADHFSLNGYTRKTNPRLEKAEVISFANTWSCGTSTAVSVPCMFSIYNRSDYSKAKANETENVLDILQRAGVNVIWLDNNSDSKGVAARVPYDSYKKSDKNSICDIECRDEGMLTNLQSYIDTHPQGDIFIVLHQMGNHGPAYFKRYPPEFKKFTPTCETNQLENCTKAEIRNTYDNVILYTDYFLSKAIDLLKQNTNQFEAALFYISDHGESLGENGLYLHGLPYMFAPDAQKHVPMIMWFSDSFDMRREVNYTRLKEQTQNKYSHDNLFHTILGLMEIETEVYDPAMDIISHQDER